jgi:hypothetical protein
VLTLVSGAARWSLVLPNGGDSSPLAAYVLSAGHPASLTCLHLAEGTSETVDATAVALRMALERAPGPTLFITRA